MTEIIPRDASLMNMSSSVLMDESNHSTPVLRSKIYHELSLRIKEEPDLETFILAVICENKNSVEYFFGFIKVSWIPAISILSSGNANSILKLKETLRSNWSKEERTDFYEYVKREFAIRDIVE